MTVIISKGIMYLCLAILMGYTLLNLIPPTRKPVIHVSRRIIGVVIPLLAAVLLIPIVSLSRYVAQETGERFWPIFQSILFSFEMGKAWLIILLLLSGLAVLYFSRLMEKYTSLRYVAFFLMLGVVFAQGWASHPSSVEGLLGFIAQSFHVLAISLWIGGLLIVAWFTPRNTEWLPFLFWFTPLAAGCVGIMIITGVTMMSFITPYLAESLILPYGQTLLIKHILIVPVLLFGLINGFLLRHRLKTNPSFAPQRWMRAESGLALGVFAVTAYLTEQAPPHEEIARTFQFTGASPLFEWFFPQVIEPSQLSFVFSWWTLIGLVASLIFISILLLGVRVKSVLLSFASAVLVAASLYVAVMLSVDIQQPPAGQETGTTEYIEFGGSFCH
ncbi:putative copper resistance protein D [Caldalkalibacillus uzonensis]|uniref:Copper resistance protein D n=1 Tax=Caldalkalibacillus uzonensis TaxID=353224 RepID=A0ABU0CPZ2_9BACI|nr:CopD family protein [Caldalkalibacillus uzonensis]MDQ0338488.1 putative copper resistance protein D [Caldalkalibacillus uzonensis]